MLLLKKHYRMLLFLHNVIHITRTLQFKDLTLITKRVNHHSKYISLKVHFDYFLLIMDNVVYYTM